MIRQKRNEGWRGAFSRSRQHKPARSRKPPPIVNLLRPASMPLSQLRHNYARSQALHHNARLNVVRPAPPLLTAREQLDPSWGYGPWVVRSVVRKVHCPLHATVVEDPPSADYEINKGLAAPLTVRLWVWALRSLRPILTTTDAKKARSEEVFRPCSRQHYACFYEPVDS